MSATNPLLSAEVQATHSQGHSTGMSASPSTHPANVTFNPKGTTHVHIRPKDEDENSKPYDYYGQIRGKNWKWRGHHESRRAEQLDKQTAEVWKSGQALLKKYWQATKDGNISLGRLYMCGNDGRKIGQADFQKKIEELIKQHHPNAQNFAINFSDLSLRYTENGQVHEIAKDALPKEALEILQFLETWQDAHDTVMLILGIRSWHTRLGISGNRSVHGDTPFVLGANTTLDAYMPNTHEEFIKDHMETLLASLPDDCDPAQAQNRIRGVHAFIEKFKADIQAKLSAAPPPPKEEIESLEKMKAKLDEIKGTALFCLYWAVAFIGDTNLSAMSADDKTKRAELLQNKLMELFEGNRLLNPDKWKTPMNIINGGFKSKPALDDLKSIAIQAADLYFHSDLDYLARFDSSGARRMVRPSAAELTMNNLMNKDQPGYVDDLTSLGMPTMEPLIQQSVRDMIGAARTAAASA